MIITTEKQMRPRDQHDFYPTPLPLAYYALNMLIPHPAYPRIFDPGAGTGVWGHAARRIFPQAWIAGLELRPTGRADHYDHWYHEQDYLDPDYYPPLVDFVIGNPPYRYAEQFVRKALTHVNEGWYVLFLLRLAFLEGQARARGLYREFPLKEVHVLPARPSFITEGEKAGRTDATAYAIFIWQKGWTGTTELGWLDWKDGQS